MRLFRGMLLEVVREISFEIGMLGQHGLDIKDPGEPCPAGAADAARLSF
ncbi:MAG: hypothetical protein WBH08_09755 [Methanothrix sp.]